MSDNGLDEETETSSGSEVEPTSTSESDDEDDEEPGAPTTETTMSDDGDFPMSLGCFRDDADNRVLMNRYVNDMMTTEVSGGAGFDGQSAYIVDRCCRTFVRRFRIP